MTRSGSIQTAPERCITTSRLTYQYRSAGLVLCPGPAEAINTPKGLESFFYSIFHRLKIRMHYVESGQIVSFSCWLAAAARPRGSAGHTADCFDRNLGPDSD